MKKLFILLFLCLCHLVLAAPLQDHHIDPKAICQLAAALGISPDKNILEEVQKHWLRKAGKERWEMEELSSEQQVLVLEWAEKHSFFAAWKPSESTYDKALILGGTTCRMQLRLNYLKQLWEEGIRFQEIVWLTGDRPLDTRVDDLLDRCNNESEAARLLWQETDLPKEMRELPVVFIAVPMKGEGPTAKRPNTKDTIVAWTDVTPEPCTALFISDQPFCGYQFAVIETVLPQSFPFDVAGPGIDAVSTPGITAVALDSLARWMYEESLIFPCKYQACNTMCNN